MRYRLPCAALQGHSPEQQQQQRSIELLLSASEFLDRVAALIPPPRKHRRRYFGVLAPNSPWRALVAAQNSKLHRNLNLCSQSVRLLRLDMAAESTGFAAFTLRSCAAESPALRAVWCDAYTRYAEDSLEMEFAQRLAAPEAVFEAIPELDFDQTANLRAEALHERLLHNAGVDAELIPELEFDQTLGW